MNSLRNRVRVKRDGTVKTRQIATSLFSYLAPRYLSEEQLEERNKIYESNQRTYGLGSSAQCHIHHLDGSYDTTAKSSESFTRMEQVMKTKRTKRPRHQWKNKTTKGIRVPDRNAGRARALNASSSVPAIIKVKGTAMPLVETVKQEKKQTGQVSDQGEWQTRNVVYVLVSSADDVLIASGMTALQDILDHADLLGLGITSELRGHHYRNGSPIESRKAVEVGCPEQQTTWPTTRENPNLREWE
ncbi:hypothetical protein IAT40_007685 [Kwoniella sp. CBS 6097]